MIREKIRKNAKSKINSLLNDSVGIILSKSTSNVDDSVISTYSIASAEDVISWLSIPRNYNYASCYIEDGVFVVGGKYYFQDRFMIYFNDVEFAEKSKLYGVFTKSDECDVERNNIIDFSIYLNKRKANN